MSSMPFAFPDDTQQSPGLSSASDGRNDAQTDKYQTIPDSDTAVQTSQPRPAVEASISLTTLNKRKRDEQDDDAQRDRDLMPLPAAPSANFLNGKGKGKAVEPPAPIAVNNQVIPNVVFPPVARYEIEFILPSGMITLAKNPASRGAITVWILDQDHTGVAWPARLHTREELADVAYRKAFDPSYQRIIHLPMTADGRVHNSGLVLISLGSPESRKQLGRLDTVNIARILLSEQEGRFLEQLRELESWCRSNMTFNVNSSGFGGPSNPSEAGQSTAPQELFYPLSSYPSATVTISDYITPPEDTDARHPPSTQHATADETPDDVLGDDDLWTFLASIGTNTEDNDYFQTEASFTSVIPSSLNNFINGVWR